MRYRAAVLTVLLGMLAALPTAGAWGHAAGELPRARLSADGPQVFVEWTAPPDDAADVGVAVGLLSDDAVVALLGGPEDGLPTDEEIRTLTRSTELRAYLLDNVRVRQGDRACEADVETGEDFLTGGARFVFTCPEPVSQAHVQVTMLHDRDELYATYAVDGTSQYAVHTASQPEHPWDFTLAAADQATGGGPALLAGGAVAALAIVAAGWALGPRRRRSVGG